MDRCLLFHKWTQMPHFRKELVVHHRRFCERCGRQEDGVYDMAYGGTVWEKV